MFNSLSVRQLAAHSSKRKLSFKNVSNVVIQLLHTIKYSVDVPFANMAMLGNNSNANLSSLNSAQNNNNNSVQDNIFNRKVCIYFFFIYLLYILMNVYNFL